MQRVEGPDRLLADAEARAEARRRRVPLAALESPATATLPPAVTGTGVEKPPRPRTCISCCETDSALIRPCICGSDWCSECLHDRFLMALKDKTMFPARCCSFLQLHTVLPQLSTEQANQYRNAFEEWMSPKKTYCPSPSCSTFISDRLSNKKASAPTLRTILAAIFTRLNASQSARFFREEPDITHLPGHTSVVENPIYLTEIHAKLGEYTSPTELTRDMQLILSNAQLHGSDHPIAQAANELFDLYVYEISESLGIQLHSGQKASFQCPKCRLAICAACKKHTHHGACDTSERDGELAMLAKFGYKQCPRCGHGVRKMYGCSHIVCRCGAGWCWGCTRSIDLCGGACGYDEEADEDEDDEDDEVEVFADEFGNERTEGVPVPGTMGLSLTQRLLARGQIAEPVESTNLDAGGERRWMAQDLDFGDEPEEEGAALQVWSCEHSFKRYQHPKDGFFHGDPLLIECNRCFKGCPGGKGASSCKMCHILVCSGCKDLYKVAKSER